MTAILLLFCIVLPFVLLGILDGKAIQMEVKYKNTPYKYNWKEAAKYIVKQEKEYKAFLKAQNRNISIGYSNLQRCEEFALAYPEMDRRKTANKNRGIIQEDKDSKDQ